MTLEKIGKYQLVSELGRGGMARVYLAEHPRLNRRVAIKVMREELAKEVAFLVRFQEEAQNVATLQHPNVMQIYDFDVSEEQQAYMVMEFVDGYSLRDMLRQHHGQILLDEALRVVSDIGRALGYAHALGIVHRDVKPANVMMGKNGRVVLADFGLAQLLSKETSNELRGIQGTPNYMAPEQGKGEAVDGRADIYALGIILFEIVTGQLPFKASSTPQMILRHIHTPPPNPQELNPNLPTWLADVVLQCLAKSPADRFETAEDFIEQLNLRQGGRFGQKNWRILPTKDKEAPNDETISGAHLLDQTTTGDEVGSYPELLAEMRRLQAELSQISGGNISRGQLPLPPFQAPPVLPQFIVHPESLPQFISKVEAGREKVWGVYGLAAVGKSSAVAYLANQLKTHFQDGILWANLSMGTAESELVSIASAFEQTETISKLPDLAAKADFMRQLLASKQILLVLDQVQESEQLQWLLPHGAQNYVVITTRNLKVLQNLGAETLEIPPFNENQTSLFLRQVLGTERLLAEITAARQLHHLVGGLPLALSIVAGYLKESDELTLIEYNEILQDEQTRLENLADWEDGNRNVSALFELSYQNLPTHIQEVLQALALFEGGSFSSEAVAAVVGQPWARVKLALGRLYTLSLIGKNTAEQYNINPLVRLFANHKLTTHRPSYTERLIAYYTAFAQQNQVIDEFAQLDAEWPNLRATLQLAETQHHPTALVQLCLSLTHQELGVIGYWGLRGLWGEARYWLERATAVATTSFTNDIQAILLTRWAAFAARQGETEEALARLYKAQALWAVAPDSVAWAQAFTHDALAQALLQRDRHLGLVELEKASDILTAASSPKAIHELGYMEIQRAEIVARLGQFDVAIPLLNRALHRLPNFPTAAKGKALSLLGTIALIQGQADQSRQYFNQAVAVSDILGDVPRLAILWLNKGVLERNTGHLRLAWQFFNKALALFEKMGDTYNASGTRLNLGQLQMRLGESEAAKAQLEAAVQLAQSKQLIEIEALAYSNLAEMAVQLGDVKAAQTHLAHAQTICDHLKLFGLRPTLARTAAQLTLYQNEPELALAQAEGALQLAVASRDTAEQGIIWQVKGTALSALNQTTEAVEAYEQALALLVDQPYELALTQLALANHYAKNMLADWPTIRELRQ